MKKVRDHYFDKAKKENFAARSIYKLEEIDQKQRILRKGDRVLDLGCFPGSWLQYISKKVGPSGSVLGVRLLSRTAAGFGSGLDRSPLGFLRLLLCGRDVRVLVMGINSWSGNVHSQIAGHEGEGTAYSAVWNHTDP